MLPEEREAGGIILILLVYVLFGLYVLVSVCFRNGVIFAPRPDVKLVVSQLFFPASAYCSDGGGKLGIGSASQGLGE